MWHNWWRFACAFLNCCALNPPCRKLSIMLGQTLKPCLQYLIGISCFILASAWVARVIYSTTSWWVISTQSFRCGETLFTVTLLISSYQHHLLPPPCAQCFGVVKPFPMLYSLSYLKKKKTMFYFFSAIMFYVFSFVYFTF